MVEGYKKIAIKFKHFNRNINAVWEAYSAINYYSKLTHKSIKKNEMPPFQLKSLTGNQTNKFSKNRTYGVLAHIIDKKNPRNALIDSISLFEHYICYIVSTVYLDYPGILKNQIGPDSSSRHQKLLDWIIDSQNKDEMINLLIEDKVRNLFYGSPSEFFIKDKAHLNFNNYFQNNHKDLINNFIEIKARRNIYVHNDGKVDSKYIKEVQNISYKKGQIAKMDDKYIKQTINSLKSLAVLVTVHVIKKIYKVNNVNTLIDKTYLKAIK